MKIRDICEYGKKSNIKAGEASSKGAVIFFSSSSETNKFVNEGQFTRPGIIMGTGGNATLHYCDQPFSVSTDCIVLFPKLNISTKYLYYFFKGNFHVLQSGFKGAGLKHTSKKYIDEISIDHIPSIDEQNVIVNRLDKIHDLILKKQQQISKYDELIKSQFIEIFGDIFTNDKCFKIGLFKDFVAKINIGPFGSSLKKEYFVSKEDSYCMVYEQKHAIEKNIEIERRYVNYSKYKELSRFEVSPGDIIVSCRGTIGKCHLLPTNAPIGIIHPSLMMIKPKDKTNPNFLLFLLERILERQFESGSGVKMAIKAKDLSKIKTISPDKNIQDKYIFFVKKIDRLKSIARQSLNETQQLFDSLMQEYFG
jgi:type I restriction enzyme S subunit